MRGASTSSHSTNAYYAGTATYQTACMTRYGTGSYGFAFYELLTEA